MKRNIKKLNLMVRYGIINPEDFYSITIDGSIKFQGHYNPSLTKKIQGNQKWKNCFDANGYIELKRSNIKIILTD